jgi:hypothetical protein
MGGGDKQGLIVFRLMQESGWHFYARAPRPPLAAAQGRKHSLPKCQRFGWAHAHVQGGWIGHGDARRRKFLSIKHGKTDTKGGNYQLGFSQPRPAALKQSRIIAKATCLP